jgi:hypothetical protein
VLDGEGAAKAKGKSVPLRLVKVDLGVRTELISPFNLSPYEL